MKSHQETLEESCLAMIAQGRPGWDENTSRCSWTAGCAAAQLVSPEQRMRIQCDVYQNASDHPARGVLSKLGHDPDFVSALQSAHDRAAYQTGGDLLGWRHCWLSLLSDHLAPDYDLNLAPVLEAARAAGWEIPE